MSDLTNTFHALSEKGQDDDHHIKRKNGFFKPRTAGKIETMTAELVAEEKSLRDLHQALALTQEHVAEILHAKHVKP